MSFSFGYSTAISQLLTVPPYVFASASFSFCLGLSLKQSRLDSYCAWLLCPLFRQAQDAISVRFSRPRYVSHWVLHKHLRSSIWCKILWNFLLCRWILCCVPWCRCMVRSYFCFYRYSRTHRFLGWEIILLGSINVELGWPSISVSETSAVLLPAIFIEHKTLRDSSSDVSYEFLPAENISPCQ